MTPLEAAVSLVFGTKYCDRNNWSSDDIAEHDKFCVQYATFIAEAFIAMDKEVTHLRADIEDVVAAHKLEYGLTTLHRRRTDELREMNDKLTEELIDIDTISGAFGDPQWNGEYISAGLIARRVQDAAMLWQRETERRTTAETKLKGAEAMILELTRVLALRERDLAHIEGASEEMLREEG